MSVLRVDHLTLLSIVLSLNHREAMLNECDECKSGAYRLFHFPFRGRSELKNRNSRGSVLAWAFASVSGESGGLMRHAV